MLTAVVQRSLVVATWRATAAAENITTAPTATTTEQHTATTMTIGSGIMSVALCLLDSRRGLASHPFVGLRSAFTICIAGVCITFDRGKRYRESTEQLEKCMRTAMDAAATANFRDKIILRNQMESHTFLTKNKITQTSHKVSHEALQIQNNKC